MPRNHQFQLITQYVIQLPNSFILNINFCSIVQRMEIDNANLQSQIAKMPSIQVDQNTEISTNNGPGDNDLSPDLIQADNSLSPIFKCLNWIFRRIPCLRDCISKTEETTETFYKRHKRKIYGLISIIMTIVVIINYQSFKEHCPYDNQQTCLKKFIFPQIPGWLVKIIIDCVFSVIQVHFLLYRVTNRFISIGGVLQIMYLYLLSDQTISPTYYIGAINFIHILFLGILLILYFLVISVISCYKKNKYIVLLAFITIVFICFFIYILLLNDSCDYWENGINGKIQKTSNLCTVKTPSLCWYYILDGHFGLSWLFNNCYLSSQAQANFDKYFQSARQTGHFIAFPNPSKFTQLERYDTNMQKSVMKYAKGFNSLKQAVQSQQKPDIVFDSQKQRYYIEIQKNQTLINERKVLWDTSLNSSSPPLAKDVIFLYVDAISRQSVHLKLPDVAKWFKDRTVMKSYQKSSQEQTAKQQSYQFYRYNSVEPWTQPNQITMFYGIRQDHYYQNKDKNTQLVQSIVQSYKRRGYITGSANSICQTISANFDTPQTEFCHSTRFDHQSQSFACDPNFQDPQNFYSNSQGPYSGGSRCLYGKIVSDYATQYAQSFFQTYKNQPKFFSMQLLEGHQGTGEGVKALNKPLSTMLKSLQQKGLLKDTMVMLISDHGLHMHGLLYAFGVQNVKTQMNLPVLMVDLPPNMNRIFRNKIRINQQYVITCKNVYHYLKHIVTGDEYESKNMSLLSDLTENNSCRSVDILEMKLCSCSS